MMEYSRQLIQYALSGLSNGAIYALIGFGFAIDDAGAGYASFSVIAALEPTIIKIDREIVTRIGNKDSIAKKALVEAFVSFSGRIGAKTIAEGIENHRDLDALIGCGVDF